MIDPHELVIDYFDKLYPHGGYAQSTQSIKVEVERRFAGNCGNTNIRILDLCTGTGRAMALFMDDQRFDLEGVDISSMMLRKASAQYSRARFIQDDVRLLKDCAFQRETYHCVLMTSASIQLFNSVERASLFKRLYDLLIKGGIFIFDLFAPQDLAHLSNDLLVKYSESSDGKEIVILYHRIPQPRSATVRQFVHLLERRHGPWVCATSFIDYFSVSSEEMIGELEVADFKAVRFETERPTQFLMAIKGEA